MKCKEEGCIGEVDMEKPVTLQIGCHSHDSAYPCQVCGRLHWGSGNAVFSRGGQKVYLENGNIVNK